MALRQKQTLVFYFNQKNSMQTLVSDLKRRQLQRAVGESPE
jgi:hypothetical protein